jgi:drug/metabolite transporter (DMT)-like permease
VADHLRSLRLERITREDWVIIAVAAVVIFDLLALPWFSFGATITVSSATFSIGGSLTGVDAPDAWLGVLALLACAFLLGDLATERLSPQTRLPSIVADRETSRFILACVAAGLIAVKFVLHIGRFGELALGFWLAVLLVAALIALTRRARQLESVPEAAAPEAAAPETGTTV